MPQPGYNPCNVEVTRVPSGTGGNSGAKAWSATESRSGGCTTRQRRAPSCSSFRRSPIIPKVPEACRPAELAPWFDEPRQGGAS